MSTIATSVVHHIALTVTDVARSVHFYTTLFGMQVIAELPPKILMTNGTIILAVGSSPDPGQALPNDRFSENRVGLDHVSLSVATRADLENAIAILDQQGVTHGEVVEYAPFGIAVLTFRDPDNIQLELTSPIA